MTNRLGSEKSPYLKLHAENPVDWYPWGEEALNLAKTVNKPILLSIGYTACHWCHVMAHESFEDEQTAQMMNNYFVNIKVDREERPDLDKIYQLSAQLLTQQVGGWPLTIFLQPDNLLPFFAGTYYPKVRRGQYPAFHEVLHYVHHLYTHRQEDIEKQSASFQAVLKELNGQAQQSSPILSFEVIQQGQQGLKKSFDSEYGGFGSSAPKFPMVSALERFLLLPDHESLQMLMFTLKQMTSSGLYDHLGGGFFRYTVDRAWQIPHFEKMLYDNGLLLNLLAWTEIHEEQGDFKSYINSTADWLLREMHAPEGGFFATLSADSEGQEGKYYVWTQDEIKQALVNDQYTLFADYYGLSAPANFDHRWHLHVAKPLDEAAQALGLNSDAAEQQLQAAQQKLLLLRTKRAYPMRDEKIIVAWNGLIIKALALIGFWQQEQRYIDAASKAVEFIRSKLWDGEMLSSVYIDGTINEHATLDDYVFLIEGLLYLLQARWDSAHFKFLQELIDGVMSKFKDHDHGGFYYSAAGQSDLIYRMKQYADDAIPASNAVFATVLQQIGYLLGDTTMLQLAEKSLSNALPVVKQHPDFYGAFLTALQFFDQPTRIIIVRGDSDPLKAWQQIARQYMQPNQFSFFIDNAEVLPVFEDKKSPSGEPMAFVCEGYTCHAPITKIEVFEDELRRFKGGRR